MLSILRLRRKRRATKAGHTGSIGRTANQAMSQSLPSEELSDFSNNEGRNLPSPAPPPNISVPVVRPLHPPPALALKIPRPPGAPQYSIPTSTDVFNAPQARMPVMQMISLIKPLPPMFISSTQPQPIPPMGPPVSVSIPSIRVPPPPGSQFTALPAARPFVPMHVPPPAMPPMVPRPPFLDEYHLHQDPNSHLCLQLGALYLCTCLHLLCHPWCPSYLCLKEYLHHHLRKLLLCYQKNQSQRGRGLMTLHLFRRINFWLSIRYEFCQ